MTIPSNSVLKFFGGTLYNGTINFNKTKITSLTDQNFELFNNCSFKGSLDNSEVNLGWFNVEDGNTTKYNGATLKTHDSAKIQQVLDICKSGAQLNVGKIYIIRLPVSIAKKNQH